MSSILGYAIGRQVLVNLEPYGGAATTSSEIVQNSFSSALEKTLSKGNSPLRPSGFAAGCSIVFRQAVSHLKGSSGRTRTYNPPVNSLMQVGYPVGSSCF